jgi:hypothetical protein
MSDTPETDDQPIIYALNELQYQILCVDLEFARQLERERNHYRDAILTCLEKNAHLADGEDCTLIGLKRALLAK